MEVDSQEELYLHDLQLYDRPPKLSIDLRELKQIAIDRVKVLLKVEYIALKYPGLSDKECAKLLREELCAANLDDYVRLIARPETLYDTEKQIKSRKRDHVSHFILRMAFSLDLDRISWFREQEIRFYQWKCALTTAQSSKDFISIHKLNYTPIGNEEKEEIKEDLENSTTTVDDIAGVEFYKIPFNLVWPLLFARQVYLKNGYAFVPDNQISLSFVNILRTNLTKCVPDLVTALASVSDDERMTDLFKSLYSLQQDKPIVHVEKIPIDRLDELSKIAFPLCMKNHHDNLLKNHHLRHRGRFEYSLFLKQIGISLEDATKFWKDEFMKKIDEEQYTQEKYEYFLHHAYGVKGRKANYPPFKCQDLIEENVGSMDNHGCPFKHFPTDVLKETLMNCEVASSDIEDIGTRVANGNYVGACSEYFKIKHKSPPGVVISHPLVYFIESRAKLKALE